eukprot:6093826-Amphidinium_carterae.1
MTHKCFDQLQATGRIKVWPKLVTEASNPSHSWFGELGEWGWGTYFKAISVLMHAFALCHKVALTQIMKAAADRKTTGTLNANLRQS